MIEFEFEISEDQILAIHNKLKDTIVQFHKRKCKFRSHEVEI